ncbi:hypothetical protein [Idiomarina ramblicola]|uniref:Uncharacterized protein n=1 Tax=Idiomarina ramblicola TaxID=263724 RepID=A0A432Z5W0_9GAMM|nr:hypothetical protein [Idiomarina ramblicola]RUO73284.1 hypothetical protein CWI78_02220 [Idiomarina ramblicola]
MKLRALLSGLLSLLISGCFGSDIGPSEEAIKVTMSSDLKSGIVVSEINKIAETNLGTDVYPEVQARSEVTLKATEDLYAQVDRVGGAGVDFKPVMELTHKAGKQVSGSVVTRAKRNEKGVWDITFEKVEIPELRGRTLSGLNDNSYLIKGSDELAAYVAKINDAIEKQEAAREKREKERLARLEKERKEKLELEKELRKSLTGTWDTSVPFQWDGKIYSRWGISFGYKVVIPDTDDLTGVAKVTVYTRDYPKDLYSESTFEAVYEVTSNLPGFVLKEPENKGLDFTKTLVTWGYDSGDTINFTKEGNTLEGWRRGRGYYVLKRQ